ncbi:MAG TPA: AAA family ATPase [Isosphaeraceae bacterium]|nr:AAA family ATPase [Isosphaeraceae bacterium]
MRILELALHAFGPFTDVVLDLSGGQQGVHLVYGPNEAGKSSALRALKQALFGIPMQSADDFLHAYQKLRIGMRLRNGAGRELAFVRRKGTKNTLLAADGSTPLPDSALATVLKGMTEAEFTRRFAMDHDELVAGGPVGSGRERRFRSASGRRCQGVGVAGSWT